MERTAYAYDQTSAAASGHSNNEMAAEMGV